MYLCLLKMNINLNNINNVGIKNLLKNVYLEKSTPINTTRFFGVKNLKLHAITGTQ